MKKIFFLVFVYIILKGVLFSDSRTVNFNHISLKEGLSQSSIFCILQDQKGFMWFGTQDGLNKYDGYDFIIYKPDPEDPNSLSNNQINVIYEDRKGILWIGTTGGGLNKFDPRKEKFYRYGVDPGNPNALNSVFVTAICEDSKGTLWIGTAGGGLNMLNRKTDTFSRYMRESNNPNSLNNNVISSIYEDGSGVLWIGTRGGGLNRFDLQKNEFKHFQSITGNPNSLSNNVITRIYKDRSGMLWIGTAGGGLNVMDRKTGMFSRYRRDPNKSNSLSNDQVSSIYEDRSGVLWIGTGGGLNRFNKRTETFTHYRKIANDPRSLSSDFITFIYEDHSRILWVGTTDGGLNKFDREDYFDHYKSDPNNSNSLSDNFIYAMCEDHLGNLWIGTNNNGVNKFDRKTDTFSHYRNIPNDPTSLSSNFIRMIYEDSAGVIWIGTIGGGLNRFNRQTETFTSYLRNRNDFTSLSNNVVRTIYEDRSGNFWVGTTGSGLDKMDRKTGTFTHYQNIPNNPNSLNDNSIIVIYEAPTEPGILWIGTANGGLNRFDPQQETFVHYNANLADPKSLMTAYVHTICEDRDGSLWIGTHGGGLSKLIRKKGERGKFIHYTEKHGLPNNTIYSILEDENDHLWMSTNKGLSRFNPKTETFKNYYVSDGLQGNEFNAGAFCKSKSGEMFFGGLNGFNAFFPSNIKNNPYIPPIVITDFKILNKPVSIGDNSILKKSITWTEELVLFHKDYFFSFEFAALDFTTSEKNKYAFMMEGFDEDWIYTDSKKRFASYTNLKPGEYIFRIKGSNNDEIWNEKGTSIKITITPPFWQTLWFKVIIALVVIGLILRLYLKRLKNVQIKAELQTARDAQMSIMPQSDPNIEGLDISGICVPANEVGGDFFDYLWMNEKKTKIGIAIGDVSGKAMKSAMTAVMTSGMIYLEADEFKSVKEIMKRVNRPLYFKTDKKVFTALCLASIDLLTKNITFTNAGLYDPVLVSKGKVSELKGTGKKIPLGVLKDTEYHERRFQLKSGNTIIFFTDGITESKNQLNEFYGYDTLKQLLTEMDISNLSAKDIKNKIIEDVKNFSASTIQYDDMTVVVVKVLQIEKEGPVQGSSMFKVQRSKL